ncbi:MAG: GPP34 family phosphoprotein [Micromonosporaceae bacterium]
MRQPPLTFTDDYFEIAHNPDTGRARLNPVALGLGLAAGLLCEQIVDGWIVVSDGVVHPLRHREVPGESLQRRVYDLICAEPARLSIDDWLRYLSRGAHHRVGVRMVHVYGYQAETVRTGLLRRPVRVYLPVDPGRAAYTAVRLRNAVQEPGVRHDDIVAVALAVATELSEHIVLWDDEFPPGLLPSLFKKLPDPVWEVLTRTQVSVARHVMTH